MWDHILICHSMATTQRVKVCEPNLWLDTKLSSRKIFDFQLEMHRYCAEDVSISIHSFINCRPSALFTTLTSSCMCMYKTLFLSQDIQALTYEGAYIN